MTLPLEEARIQAILLDIEGATTSIDFVYQTLFLYARRHLAEFVERHYGTEALRDMFEQLRREWEADAQQKSPRHEERAVATPSDCPAWRAETREAEIESIVAYCHWLMDQDRKSTPLKSLQGMIWENGYRSGELRGHVYPDVPAAFARWKRKGKTISIFSSGSVLAQKLIFAHTDYGDLTPFISAYFDTTTGAKRDPESYQKIAAALATPPGAVLFLSDSIAELDAARSVEIETALSVRPDNPPTAPFSHRVIRSFEEVLP
ncbi:MAG: acireductone synthase [Terriglobia bacterium]